MKICIMIPGNMIGGGVKMPIRLASYLVHKHDVTIMYPVIKHYVTYQILRKTSQRQRLFYIARELLQYKRAFFFQDDLNKNVSVKKYWILPKEKVMQRFDAIIYPSVWQYHELKSLDPKNVCKIHWSLADYLFCSPVDAVLTAILEAYCSGDVVVAPSERTKADLESYGVKVHAVIHGGIDPLFNAENRKDSGVLRVLGYLQPSWWVKGGSTLVQCLRQLRQKYPNVEVSLFGHQKSDIGTTGSSFCDHFYTRLNSKQVADLYREHDIFLFPSYSEGFQSPPLEAMACGCAVVATRVGAVPEYSKEGETALLCQPMDHVDMFQQLERLIQDNELRRRLGANAAKTAANWRWEDCAYKFESLLHNLI